MQWLSKKHITKMGMFALRAGPLKARFHRNAAHAISVRAKMRSSMDQLFIYFINIYKRHISPHKGFSCAHRVLYGQESCSSYVKSSIKVCGWKRAILLIPARAHACAMAARKLEEDNSKPKRRKKDDESLAGYCLGEVAGNAACCFLFN